MRDAVNSAGSNCEDCFYGSVTVGERGQVVIPADVRKSLSISPGDRLLVFRQPNGHGIMFAKFDSVQEVISSFQAALTAVAKAAAEPAVAEEDHS